MSEGPANYFNEDEVVTTFTRVKTLAGVPVDRVAAGLGHSLAVTSIGELFSWGSGADGQLGVGVWGEGFCRPQPTPVMALRDRVVVGVAAGDLHSLVVTAAGELYTFGCGRNGRLGHNNEDTFTTPHRVQALQGQHVITVSAGAHHSLAVTSAGSLYSFGSGRSGKLGLGDTRDRLVPTLVFRLHDEEVAQCAAGPSHSMAVTSAGVLYAFGRGHTGQLGLGDTCDQAYPCRVAAFDGMQVTMVAAGGNLTGSHTLVVTAPSAQFPHGRLWAFGSAEDGRLGHTAPVPASFGVGYDAYDDLLQANARITAARPPLGVPPAITHDVLVAAVAAAAAEEDNKTPATATPEKATGKPSSPTPPTFVPAPRVHPPAPPPAVLVPVPGSPPQLSSEKPHGLCSTPSTPTTPLPPVLERSALESPSLNTSNNSLPLNSSGSSLTMLMLPPSPLSGDGRPSAFSPFGHRRSGSACVVGSDTSAQASSSAGPSSPATLAPGRERGERGSAFSPVCASPTRRQGSQEAGSKPVSPLSLAAGVARPPRIVASTARAGSTRVRPFPGPLSKSEPASPAPLGKSQPASPAPVIAEPQNTNGKARETAQAVAAVANTATVGDLGIASKAEPLDVPANEGANEGTTCAAAPADASVVVPCEKVAVAPTQDAAAAVSTQDEATTACVSTGGVVHDAGGRGAGAESPNAPGPAPATDGPLAPRRSTSSPNVAPKETAETKAAQEAAESQGAEEPTEAKNAAVTQDPNEPVQEAKEDASATVPQQQQIVAIGETAQSSQPVPDAVANEQICATDAQLVPEQLADQAQSASVAQTSVEAPFADANMDSRNAENAAAGNNTAADDAPSAEAPTGTNVDSSGRNEPGQLSRAPSLMLPQHDGLTGARAIAAAMAEAANALSEPQEGVASEGVASAVLPPPQSEGNANPPVGKLSSGESTPRTVTLAGSKGSSFASPFAGTQDKWETVAPLAATLPSAHWRASSVASSSRASSVPHTDSVAGRGSARRISDGDYDSDLASTHGATTTTVDTDAGDDRESAGGAATSASETEDKRASVDVDLEPLDVVDKEVAELAIVTTSMSDHIPSAPPTELAEETGEDDDDEVEEDEDFGSDADAEESIDDGDAPMKVRDCLVPRPVEGLDGYPIVHISAGGRHAIVVTGFGDVFTFGCGALGQLGNGAEESLHVPVRVASFRGLAGVAAAAGGDHSLVVTDQTGALAELFVTLETIIKWALHKHLPRQDDEESSDSSSDSEERPQRIVTYIEPVRKVRHIVYPPPPGKPYFVYTYEGGRELQKYASSSSSWSSTSSDGERSIISAGGTRRRVADVDGEDEGAYSNDSEVSSILIDGLPADNFSVKSGDSALSDDTTKLVKFFDSMGTLPPEMRLLVLRFSLPNPPRRMPTDAQIQEYRKMMPTLNENHAKSIQVIAVAVAEARYGNLDLIPKGSETRASCARLLFAVKTWLVDAEKGMTCFVTLKQRRRVTHIITKRVAHMGYWDFFGGNVRPETFIRRLLQPSK